MSAEPLSPLAAWFRSSRRMLAAELSQGGWLNFGQFRWSAVDVPRALRAGAGMITPLALGLATGHLEYGVFASLGALPAGFVSFQGASRTRVTAVVLAAAGMAIATFIGGVAAWTSGWLLLPAVLAFSYLAGLLAALGQRFLVVGLQWAIQLVIASAIPLAPGDAALRAALVLAGGLWQGALVVASWAFTRGSQERSALADAYRMSAAYAEANCRRPAGSEPLPPPPAVDSDAINDPNPLLRAEDRYRFVLMLEQAERIRVSLAAVAGYGSQCSLLEPAARVLDGIADALDARRGHRAQAIALEHALAAIELPSDAEWRWAGAALLGEMRGAVRILGHLDDRGVVPTPEPMGRRGRPLGTWRSNLTSAIVTLAASAGTSTENGRHALRLAVVASIGQIVAQASGLPHGYWIVLTILIVLRPDYASTIYRGVQRAGGTVIGAGLGLATALLLHAGTAVLVAAVGVTMTIAYAVFAVNYLLFAVFLTDFVVTLLALLGETAEQTVGYRLIGTGIGAALALIGYLVWPSWEGESAQQKLARLFETQAAYASLLLRAYVRPGHADTAAMRSAQRTARRARAEAEASADRLAEEPARPPMTARLAYGLTGIGRRLAHASLTLHAAIESTHAADRSRAGMAAPPTTPTPAPVGAARSPDDRAPSAALPRRAPAAGVPGDRGGTGGDDPQQEGSQQDAAEQDAAEQHKVVAIVDRFADGVEVAGRVVAGSLRSLRPPGDMPPLREMQTALYSELAGLGSGSGSGSAAGQNGEEGTGPAAGADAGTGTGVSAVPGASAGVALAGPDTVLFGVTDEFTDSFDTAADVLRDRLSG